MRNLSWIIFITIAVNVSTARRTFVRNFINMNFLKQSNIPQFDDQWFDQILDHFNSTETHTNATWKQRYLINSEYYEKNGPVFLMLGGESEISSQRMTNDMWIKYGKPHKALYIQLEHRFYGKSHPTANISVKNLAYLSSEQALADAAYFIEEFNRIYQIPNGTKWIIFGGSYSGNLAAWARLKYPHLVYGAIASSAPVLATVDFQDYIVTVQNSLARYSQSCVTAIEDASKEIHIMLRHSIGRQGLFKKFNLCDPLDDIKKVDIASLYYGIADYVFGVVQYNKDNRISSNTSKFTIDYTCDILLNDKIGAPVDRLAKFIELISKAQNTSCLDYIYDKGIQELRNFSWSDSEEIAWIYQTCTEFGYFQSSTARPHLFYSDTFPLDYYVQTCIDIFGPRFNLDFVKSAVSRTNAVYGGRNLNVTNVVFINGNIDPWHTLGITKPLNLQAPVFLLDGTAHCADMYPPSERDLPQLIQVRLQIQKVIDKWITDK